MFQPNLLYAAEIKHFEIVWISSGLVSRWRQESTRKVVTIAAQIHALRFDALQSCASVWKMKMLSVLLAATLARYFFLRNAHFYMNPPGKLICQIICVQFTIEAVEPQGAVEAFLSFMVPPYYY